MRSSSIIDGAVTEYFGLEWPTTGSWALRLLKTGVVLEMFNVFEEMDLIVISTRSDGLPIVAIEAVNFRLPLLASDIELFRRFQIQSVKRFEAGSVESFSECVRWGVC
ncbi:MAG: hypothetical protein KC592_19485 [Nitrospira sp.]|nr:hypothetical protein [Nitrospira sp.]